MVLWLKEMCLMDPVFQAFDSDWEIKKIWLCLLGVISLSGHSGDFTTDSDSL